MLDRTRKKLQSYLDTDPQKCLDGRFREIDNVTRISMREIERLMSIYKSVSPDLSAEAGMAYGFSTLSMLDLIEENGHGHHISIDPGQIEMWHGIALKSIEELGFARNFTWMETNSDRAFAQLITEGKTLHFIFLDGTHYFDGMITDFFLASQLLDIDGAIVFNNLWMPSGRAIRSFINNNVTNFTSVPVESEQLFAFRKTGKESRPWNHFVPFDGIGGQNEPDRPGLFRKVFKKRGD